MSKIFAKDYQIGQKFRLKQNDMAVVVQLGGVKYFKNKNKGILDSIDGSVLEKQVIELITCESRDWEVLRLNAGEKFEKSRHKILSRNWIELIETLGYEVIQREISDKDMESCNY